MKAYFKGDKSVFVFDPIPKSQKGRKKKMSNFDRILNGTEEDLVDELEKAITWARELDEDQWNDILNSRGGLRGFIRETMEK